MLAIEIYRWPISDCNGALSNANEILAFSEISEIHKNGVPPRYYLPIMLFVTVLPPLDLIEECDIGRGQRPFTWR